MLVLGHGHGEGLAQLAGCVLTGVQALEGTGKEELALFYGGITQVWHRTVPSHLTARVALAKQSLTWRNHG